MWKKDENGNLVVGEGGNPVLVTQDGKEEEFNLDANKQYIDGLKAESIGRRKELTELKDQYKQYEGLDVAQAREALEKVKKIGDKELIDAGKVDEVRAEMKSNYEALLDSEKQRAAALENQMRSYVIGQSFADSKFIADKLSIPLDMARTHFGRNFTVTSDNKVVALRDANDPNSIIYSASNPSEPASFDEAIASFVNNYEYRDQILKSSGNQGAGTNRGTGLGSNSPKSLSDCKTEAQKVAYLESLNN